MANQNKDLSKSIDAISKLLSSKKNEEPIKPVIEKPKPESSKVHSIKELQLPLGL